MSDVHSFSVEVANDVGVNAAILLQNIKYWCQKNMANNKHFHDGLYWTYNSTKAWCELYPYLGKGAIGSALKRLEERGYIVTGNYNKSAYDRTKWYAITGKGLSLFGESIYQKKEMEDSESGNPNNETVQPIPDINQFQDQIETHMYGEKMAPERKKGKGFTPPTLEEVRAYVAEKGYHFDPRQFFEYYDSDDWHMGNGQKVKSWKRCCVTWERNRSYDSGGGKTRRSSSDDDFSQFMRNDGVVSTWEDENGQMSILRS